MKCLFDFVQDFFGSRCNRMVMKTICKDIQWLGMTFVKFVQKLINVGSVFQNQIYRNHAIDIMFHDNIQNGST